MESFDLLLLLLLLLLILVSSIFFSGNRKRSSSPNGRLPPGPKPLPVVGNLLDLGDNPHQSLARLAKTYGPVMTLRLGQVITVVISSPQMAREVLQKHDAVFSSRSLPDAIKILGHHEDSMVWLPPSKKWRNLRRFCNAHLFSPERLDVFDSLRRQKVGEMMSYISSLASEGSLIHVGQVAFTTTLNLISQEVFSTDLADLRTESSREFMDVVENIMMEVGRANISDFFPFLARFDPQGIHHRSTGLFKRVRDIIDEQIDRRLSRIDQTQSTGTEKYDFLDALLRFQVRDDGAKFDRPAMKSLLSDLFIAGSDTSSGTVEWAMAELARNPVAMDKAREEIAGVIGMEAEVKESDISRLPYLQAVVKETFRLHPPAPFLIPRRVETKVELPAGCVIPEGTRVLVNTWAIGRDCDVWPDPEKFLPERFLEKQEVNYRGRDFELIPFGAGRRICPGLPLAYRVVHLMLAALLQRFEWRLPEGVEPKEVDMSEKFGVTLAMADPIKLVAIPIYSPSI